MKQELITVSQNFQLNRPMTNIFFSLLAAVEIPANFTRPVDKLAGRAAATGPAVIELVIVVDKEFGDVFQQNYQKVVDYLTIYFWDVNIRYKSLWSVDLSFRVNGLLIMAVRRQSTLDKKFVIHKFFSVQRRSAIHRECESR